MHPGEKLPERIYRVTRGDLVRYAGASGDFNPIHWSDSAATAVGLPGVIAHGMFTMALAGRALADWAGDPGAIVEFGVRFTRPVIVPDDDQGASVAVRGVVKQVMDNATARIDLTVSCGEDKVLGQARGVVRVPGTVPKPGDIPATR